MTYKYKCPHCKIEIDIVKPMNESDHAEYCDECGNELKRVYEASTIITADGIKR